MTPVVVLVPMSVWVAGQTWSKRTPQPQYPEQKRRETWPLRQGIPKPDDRARDMLDSARRSIAEKRLALAREATRQ
jgi:hypothetical protein